MKREAGHDLQRRTPHRLPTREPAPVRRVLTLGLRGSTGKPVRQTANGEAGAGDGQLVRVTRRQRGPGLRRARYYRPLQLNRPSLLVEVALGMTLLNPGYPLVAALLVEMLRSKSRARSSNSFGRVRQLFRPGPRVVGQSELAAASVARFGLRAAPTTWRAVARLERSKRPQG